MSGDKIQDLQDAATEFVDLLLADGDDAQITISLIPYNAAVNLGPTLGEHFILSDFQTYSYCATFETSDFYDTAIDPNVELERLGHFQASSGPTNDNLNDP